MGSKRIPVQEAEAGMLLVQAILDDKGRTIVPAEARLTPAHVKRLERWGIQEIVIDQESNTSVINRADASARKEAAATSATTEEAREKMRCVAEAVQSRFQNISDNPLMDELKRLAVRHLVMNSEKGQIPGIRLD